MVGAIDYLLFSDGRSRAGVYCAANACIEQVIQHGEVDIFQAVKTVRRHRPQLIENMVNQSIFMLNESDCLRGSQEVSHFFFSCFHFIKIAHSSLINDTFSDRIQILL